MADGAIGTNQQKKAELTAWAYGLAAASDLQITASITKEEPEGLTVSFDGPDARLLVGRSGQVLDALQYLASLSINGRGGMGRLHIVFDADGYRVRREETLRRVAQELAEQVLATGQEAVLDPLSPLERRIVHQAVMETPGVRTYSEGEEPDRYIVIAPAES